MQVRSRAALRPDTRQIEYHTGDTATSSPGKRWQFRIGGISRPASLVIPTKAGIQGFLATLEFYSLLALLDSGLRRNDEFAVSVNINSELLRQAHLNSSSNCAGGARKESLHPVRRHATVNFSARIRHLHNFVDLNLATGVKPEVRMPFQQGLGGVHIPGFQYRVAHNTPVAG